ncbi:MAG: oxidoreductase [Mycobacterium sp.]|nr:oxidoreductase [Mycobacterium sp.]
MLGATLLIAIAATHVYVLTSRRALPVYFVVYTAALLACCLLSATAIWLGRKPLVPRLGWFLGDVVSVVFVGVYLASRAASLPGLMAVTGRWDFAPGTLAGAFALSFIAIHMSVLLGINVAYPQRQPWTD